MIACDLTHVGMVLATAVAAGAAPSAPPPTSPLATVWDLTLKGGPVMVPIALCSLVALAIVVERLVSLRRRLVLPSGFADELVTALRAGPMQAIERCGAVPCSLARVAEPALRRWDRSREVLEKQMVEAGVRESMNLRRHLRGLGVITAVAPLLGLLGTIFGMINAFRTVAANAEALGKTEMLAAGIYEAMVTTAAGLVVAIPVLLLHHWLAARVDRRMLEIDAACERILDVHDEQRERDVARPELRAA